MKKLNMKAATIQIFFVPNVEEEDTMQMIVEKKKEEVIEVNKNTITDKTTIKKEDSPRVSIVTKLDT